MKQAATLFKVFARASLSYQIIKKVLEAEGRVVTFGVARPHGRWKLFLRLARWDDKTIGELDRAYSDNQTKKFELNR